MATPNFCYWNADNVYALYDFDEITEKCARHRLDELLKDRKGLYVREIHEHDGDMSYPALFFTEINKEFEFCGVSVCVSAEIGVRSGYYCGCNLDFNIKAECGNAWGWIDPYYYWRGPKSCCGYSDPCELARDFWADVMDSSVPDLVDVPKGLLAMNKGKFARRLASEINEMADLANSLCKHLCDNEYECTALFSNGEAIYERVFNSPLKIQ